MTPAARTGLARRGALGDLVVTTAAVLGVDDVQVDSGFTDLGGDSPLALQLVSRMRAAEYELALRDLWAATRPPRSWRTGSEPVTSGLSTGNPRTARPSEIH